MKIQIYINNKPMTDYTLQELEEIKTQLTDKALAAAGYKRRKDNGILRDMCLSEAERQKEKAAM